MNYNYISYSEYVPTQCTDVITIGKPCDLYCNLVCDIRVRSYQQKKKKISSHYFLMIIYSNIYILDFYRKGKCCVVFFCFLVIFQIQFKFFLAYSNILLSKERKKVIYFALQSVAINRPPHLIVKHIKSFFMIQKSL